MNCPCPIHSPDGTPYQNVGPATVARIDGQPVLGHSRLSNGKVLCQLCFGYFWPCELHENEGQRSDVCAPCAETEAITWRCPRCSKVIVDADSRLYEFCRHCDAFTGTRKAHEICEIHRAYEPSMPDDYKTCGECCHVWRTEQEFIDDVFTAHVSCVESALRYDGVIIGPTVLGPPSEVAFCPLCAHDF